jgi:nucleotide-binding universal stress UspA family protein
MYSRILVALDGSSWSLIGGEIALDLARAEGAELLAAHVYDTGIHNLRFREMEPVLPPSYRNGEKLQELRSSHGRLISEGFESLSLGYMEEYIESARGRAVPLKIVHREGRNYITLLEIAEEFQVQLIVMGAHGLGFIPGAEMGSTALRVMRHSAQDILITRRRPSGRRIQVGIDGSPDALEAARRAEVWGRAWEGELELTAVYDPFFHDEVFKTMAASFSPQRREEVGLAKQEELHERIIDDGLGQLYRTFLERAHRQAKDSGIPVRSRLERGKAYRVLADRTRSLELGLSVVGRYGQHREERMPVGSTAEALARLSESNVLITRPAERTSEGSVRSGKQLEWEAEALDLLQRVPAFARPMARAGVERAVRGKGADRVTAEDVLGLAARLGMPGFGQEDRD